jgi:hypothetical protein
MKLRSRFLIKGAAATYLYLRQQHLLLARAVKATPVSLIPQQYSVMFKSDTLTL